MIRLGALADALNCTLEGDPEIEISGAASLDEAVAGDLSFMAAAKFIPNLIRTRASAVILDSGVASAPCAILRCSQPRRAWSRALPILLSKPPIPPPGVSPLAFVDPTAEIGEGVSIGPFVSVGARAKIGARAVLYPQVVVAPDVEIGPDTTLHSGVSIRHKVRVGARVLVHDGAIIGSDGFGFDGDEKVPQLAGVEIGDDVEIGANTTIDRPSVGTTRISRGSKLDNLIQIGHGVQVGPNARLSAQVGIAGGAVLGSGVWIGGQSGVADHVSVGDGVGIGGKAGVFRSVPAATPGRRRMQALFGTPAVPMSEWRTRERLLSSVPQLLADLKTLAARVVKLETKIATESKPRQKPAKRPIQKSLRRRKR